MFLESIQLAHTIPCLAEPDKIIVTGKPSKPLDEVLPYMATLPSIISYNPDVPALTFRRQRGFLTLYSQKVYITKVLDVEEGLQLLADLVDAINATWAHRHELKPVTAARRAPKLLDLWSQLPQTNCKQCDEATCMAFAAGLLQQKRTLTECPPLANDAALSERRATLEAMLG
jgi:ArsR family metal-binding transcriptional regulator